MSGKLEDAAAQVYDELIPGLTFKLPNAANFVTARNACTFFPQGSQYYSPTGTRLIRFVISDQNLLDLSTLRLAFQIKNNDASKGLMINPPTPQAILGRVRVYVGGVLAEDILMSGKLQGLLDRFRSADRRWTESLEFWADSTAPAAPVSAGPPATAAQYPDSAITRGPVNWYLAPNESRTALTRVISGLLDSHWWLPCKFAPLTLELELVNSASQCCARGAAPGSAATLSQDFALQNVRLLGDIVTVDNVVMEQLSSVLLEGEALPLAFTSWSNTMHTLSLTGTSNQSWAVTLSRAFSKIKSIFVTFDADGARGVGGTEWSTNLFWNGRNSYDEYYGSTNDYVAASSEGWRFQFSTGSLLIPQLPLSSAQEAAYMLGKCLALGSDGELSIPPGEWISRSFCIALDLEKAASTPGAMVAYSGLSTNDSGSTMRFAFENVNARNADSTPQRMYIWIHYDAIVEIRAEGCVLMT